MNKDAFLATLIGFGVGLLVTGIVLFGPALFKNVKFPKLPTIAFPQLGKPNVSPTPSTETLKDQTPLSHSVSIDSPLSDSLETNEKILISGATSAEATVVISSDTEDVIVLATDDGKYAGKITLVEGQNTISVTAISKDKKESSKTVTVYYTAEEL